MVGPSVEISELREGSRQKAVVFVALGLFSMNCCSLPGEMQVSVRMLSPALQHNP